MAVFSSTGAGWWRDGAGGLRAKVGASHDDNLAVGTISTQDDNGTNHVVVEQLETADADQRVEPQQRDPWSPRRG